jgi:valyl-tRNA synthetase
MAQKSTQYDPKAHESQIYERWEKSGAFAPSDSAQGEPFVIMLPPPNITGNLHVGHALQDTIMDILIRYHRMKGEPTLWVPGTDHAAIATNRVLEKQLAAEGKTRFDVGRDEFLKRADQWYQETGNTIIEQMKRLGSSADWSRTRFTLDQDYYQAVLTAFVRYYEQGYIYRGNRLVNWCPRCESVVSDLEMKYDDRTATLYYVEYPLASGQGHITVATVRPETMLGDTAVAVHPTDERYAQLIGQKVIVPLVNREVPIIADERIDAAFGTGAVKVTPAHDPFDAELAATHTLPAINVINEKGQMTAEAGEFAGLTSDEARQRVVTALQAQKLLQKEEPYTHKIAVCERCGTVIEPLLSRQWFVNMQKLKEATIAATEDNTVEFLPARWKEHFLEWMRGVHDWTISRQIWLGHRVPVWWKPGTRGTEQEEGSFTVSIEKPAGDFEQDPDVLDTWFSSALWPFAALGWPKETEDLKRFYPTSALVTGRDILYLWVARMIFSGLEFMKDIPFRQVFVHPTVLTKTGQRMSKSLGTGIDPLELIDQYGADATRFGLMSQMNYDRQAIRFDEAAIKNARNFANKIWNLARLLESLPDRAERNLADDWIEARLSQVTQEVSQLIENYHIGEAAERLYAFVWNDFADWYSEIVKTEGSTTVARAVFTDILRLLHPFMPYVTEVLWQARGETELLMTSAWPTSSPTEAPSDMPYFQEAVGTVRSARVLLALPPTAEVQVQTSRPLPLPAAFAKLTRATITDTVSKGLRFPLSHSESLLLASPAITAASITQAQARLAQHKADLERTLQHQEQILQQMQGRAPEEKITAKQTETDAIKKQLQEIAASQQILQGYVDK